MQRHPSIPESPRAAPGRVLVTGASGFIGSRLVPALLLDGVPLRCLSRRRNARFAPGAEVVAGDLLEPASLGAALAGIDTAYYLVHAMAGGRDGFARRDREAAENFVAAAEAAAVRRVIYLGGLGEAAEHLSEHLASRREVGEILRRGRFQTTCLRAAIIIGAGGASFEVIRSLVQRLPLMPTPLWVETLCQPIAVGDVVRYLVGCLFEERTAGEIFDIGGPEVLSYRQVMSRLSRVAGRFNFFFPLPFFPARLSAYGAGLLTPVPASVTVPLIEGLRNEVVCREQRIRELIPFRLTPIDRALRLALNEERTADDAAQEEG